MKISRKVHHPHTCCSIFVDWTLMKGMKAVHEEHLSLFRCDCWLFKCLCAVAHSFEHHLETISRFTRVPNPPKSTRMYQLAMFIQAHRICCAATLSTDYTKGIRERDLSLLQSGVLTQWGMRLTTKRLLCYVYHEVSMMHPTWSYHFSAQQQYTGFTYLGVVTTRKNVVFHKIYKYSNSHWSTTVHRNYKY